MFLLALFAFIHLETENFILMNGATSEVVCESGREIDQQTTPCSTFKIALSLMGYDAEILKNTLNPAWNFQEGYDDFLDSWKGSINPELWMKYSCIWYSKVLALQLGSERIKSYLASFEYGNQDIAENEIKLGNINPVWVNSTLKISPREQVLFIQKMIGEQLLISSHATEMTKALMFKEELDHGWKLFGKTGWSGSAIASDGKTLESAWFVGWIENQENFFPFAYLIRDRKIQLDQRIPRVKQLLNEAGF